jgi:hypothetical protein
MDDWHSRLYPVYPFKDLNMGNLGEIEYLSSILGAALNNVVSVFVTEGLWRWVPRCLPV